MPTRPMNMVMSPMAKSMVRPTNMVRAEHRMVTLAEVEAEVVAAEADMDSMTMVGWPWADMRMVSTALVPMPVDSSLDEVTSSVVDHF